MSRPLLTTKLYIPPRRPSLVPRSRLTAKLDDALQQRHRLILVSAKAGSGKTTLVSTWLHQQEQRAVWLSLDDNDNDPSRFLRYLTSALDRLGVKADPFDLSQLGTGPLPQIELLAEELINGMTANAASLVLVLDDYHLIQNNWVHELIGFLAEYLPSEIQLVLVTRVDPPLPLSRLRGRGQITEIRDYDLRFTEEEAAGFLNGVMQLDLPSKTVVALEQRTEGWIAGLQMAALSMQGRIRERDPAAFVEAFSGTHRYVLDYLMDEVIGLQTPAVQDFLLETSILDRLCGDLCDAVRSGTSVALHGSTELTIRRHHPSPADAANTRSELDGVRASNSRSMLLQLEQANLFVTSLDDERRWYRYHHLFADLLRSTLRQRRTVAEIRELHRRAGLWHQAAGLLEEAMGHAIAAEDFELAAALIEENVVSMLARSEVPLLLGWIDKLPAEVVQRHPWIDVYRANTLALTGQVAPVEALLADVERRIEHSDPRAAEYKGHIAAIRTYTANLQGDAERVIEMAAFTAKHLPEAHTTARGMTAYALADALFARDDLEGAYRSLDGMLEVGESTGQLLLVVTALCDLATIRKAEGRLHEAEALYTRAHQEMVRHNGLGSRVRCAYEFGMADLLREWNQLDIAYDHAETGIRYRQKLGGYLVTGDIAMMRVLQARGDVSAALDALSRAERFMQTYHFQLSIVAEFAAMRVVEWLAAGDVQMASYCAETCVGGSELEQIALAQLWLAQGRVDDALRLLGQQRPLAEGGGRTGRLIQILCLQAITMTAVGRHKQAANVLSRALSMAQPSGYVRLFLDLGEPLRDLLDLCVTHDVAQPSDLSLAPAPRRYISDLLTAFERGEGAQGYRPMVNVSLPASPDAAVIDALTSREVDVLQLLAEGLTNKAIAAQLVVASSTVKQHVKSIYSKLDVHSRTQAVARGRELGYL